MITHKVTRWALLCLAAVVAVILLVSAANHVLGLIPFTPQWSAKRTAEKAERLEGQVQTLEREAEGNAEIGQAVERHYEREVVIREVTAQAINEARNAPDADTPLSAERADRLRGHDDRLCRDAPTLCPAADPAGRGAGAVQTPDPAA